ncbi:MAG: tripartite tricarboxylate transporter substrate binding protein [SAR324 cluster bacterium]|nr:tripartite tricarboxylate transporter substrate binding protein [SAR324 cluster bacterium]
MLNKIKKSSLLAGAAIVLALSAAGSAIAETYPSKPITFVVPWGAGGRTDIVGRMVSNVIGSILEQPIAVVNRTGGRGAIGTKYVLDAAKDGYTVLVTTPGNQILGPVHRNVGFVPSDFRGIGRVAVGSVILAANKNQPFSDGKSLLEYAKANPGKVSYSAVKNVLPWLAAEALAGKAGLKFKHVPAKGDAEAVPMALGGHVNLVSSSSLNSIASHIEAGTLIPLIVFADKRLAELPDTPTATELGYAVTASPWTGIAVAKGVPEDRISVLRDALKKAVETKSIANFAKASKTTLSYLDGPGFEKQWDSEFSTFKEVVGK